MKSDLEPEGDQDNLAEDSGKVEKKVLDSSGASIVSRPILLKAPAALFNFLLTPPAKVGQWDVIFSKKLQKITSKNNNKITSKMSLTGGLTPPLLDNIQM